MIIAPADLPPLEMAAVRASVPELVPRAACYIAARADAQLTRDPVALERALRMLDAILNHLRHYYGRTEP